MSATIQETLLDLFQQVIADPDRIPAVPIDVWPEDSWQRSLLTRFRDMLTRMRQSKRQAEEQLREREEQYRSIFEATSDGLIIRDRDGFVVEANPAACNMHGYAYEEFLPLHPLTFIHPDSYPLFAEYLQTVKAGRQFHARAIDVCKNGISFPVEVWNHLHLQGQAACKMLGYNYEESIGMPPSVLVHPDSFHYVSEGLKTFVVEGHHDIPQNVVLRRDGTLTLTESHSTKFIYGGQPHFLTVSRISPSG